MWFFFFFFFKQKTAYEIVSRDWSSDVCSSDLADYIKSTMFMDDQNHVYVRDGEVRGECTAVSVMFTGANS